MLFDDRNDVVVNKFANGVADEEFVFAEKTFGVIVINALKFLHTGGLSSYSDLNNIPLIDGSLQLLCEEISKKRREKQTSRPCGDLLADIKEISNNPYFINTIFFTLVNEPAVNL